MSEVAARPRRRRGPGGQWRQHPDGSRFRVYTSYQAYAAHQAAKLDTMPAEKLREHTERFTKALRERLAMLELLHGARTALCLGARNGAEVKVIHELGVFAVGVDLNPGPANRYVVTGDFHGLVFPRSTVDIVYTNALDHVYDLTLVVREVLRVLQPLGVFIVEASSKPPSEYESFAWESIDALLASILPAGFRLLSRTPIEVPWKGEQLVLVKA